MSETCWNCGSARLDNTSECRSCGLRLAAVPAAKNPESESELTSERPADENARKPPPWALPQPAPTLSNGSPPPGPFTTASPPHVKPETPDDPTPDPQASPWSRGRSRQPGADPDPSSTGSSGRRVDVGDAPAAGGPSWLSAPGSSAPFGPPGPSPAAAPPLFGPPPGVAPPLPGPPTGARVARPSSTGPATVASARTTQPPPSAPTVPSAPRPSGHGVTTGYVQGQILEEGLEKRFWGGRLLLVVCVAALIAAVVTGGVDLVRQMTAALMPLIVLAVVIAAIPMMMGRGRGLASGMMQVGTGMARGAAGIARAGASGVRGSAGMLGRSGASTFIVTIRRFRVQDLLGTTTSCLLIGEVAGDLMRQGDLVRVEGRKNRDGVIRSRVVKVLDTVDGPVRTVVRSRLTLGYHLARVGDVLAKVAAAALAVLTVAMVAGWIG